MDVNSKPSKNSSARSSEGETMHLSPSLLPAQQPTISLLYEDTADTLSVESLTIVPPVDPHSLRALSGISQLPTLPAADTETPSYLSLQDNHQALICSDLSLSRLGS